MTEKVEDQLEAAKPEPLVEEVVCTKHCRWTCHFCDIHAKNATAKDSMRTLYFPAVD